MQIHHDGISLHLAEGAGAGHLIHDEVGSRPAFREAVIGFLARFEP